MSSEEPWYGVRLIYRHSFASGQTYEERILIIRAETAAQAIAEAESISAREYEDENTERLDYAMTFNIFDSNGPCLGPGTEVFSLMRVSELSPNDYLDHFHNTGSERSLGIDDASD